MFAGVGGGVGAGVGACVGHVGEGALVLLRVALLAPVVGVQLALLDALVLLHVATALLP